MVDLRSLRRVLALDLGLDAQAVRLCLVNLLPAYTDASDATEIPLAEALRVVALAEAGTGATALA